MGSDRTHKIVRPGCGWAQYAPNAENDYDNPMITGVMCILLGEALFFGSLPLLAWFVVSMLLNVIYIPLVEEPGLEKRFGRDYVRSKENVPRWIPRLTPWQSRQPFYVWGRRSGCVLPSGTHPLPCG